MNASLVRLLTALDDFGATPAGIPTPFKDEVGISLTDAECDALAGLIERALAAGRAA